jgi:hypothetical protein
VILNIRSTHGGGKSTAVVELMKLHTTVTPLEVNAKGRPLIYQLTHKTLGSKPTYVIGAYETACGGADGIQPYNRIWPLVEKYAKKGNVVFEGALVSCSLGSIGEEMVARKRSCVVAYLDTPLEVCIERIQKRRLKKGNTQPLNPKNTELKFKSIGNTRPRFEALGVRCVTIDYKKAARQLFEVLYGTN